MPDYFNLQFGYTVDLTNIKQVQETGHHEDAMDVVVDVLDDDLSAFVNGCLAKAEEKAKSRTGDIA